MSQAETKQKNGKQKTTGYHSRVSHVLAQQGLSRSGLKAHRRPPEQLLHDATLRVHCETLANGKADTPQGEDQWPDLASRWRLKSKLCTIPVFSMCCLRSSCRTVASKHMTALPNSFSLMRRWAYMVKPLDTKQFFKNKTKKHIRRSYKICPNYWNPAWQDVIMPFTLTPKPANYLIWQYSIWHSLKTDRQITHISSYLKVLASLLCMTTHLFKTTLAKSEVCGHAHILWSPAGKKCTELNTQTIMLLGR